MDAARHGIEVFQVPVNIGGLDLAPLAVLLHQREKTRQFRPVRITPLLEERHGHIVCRLAVGFRGLQNGQSQVFIQIVLERLRGAVRSDVHISDDEFDLLADAFHLGFSFCLSLLHEREVDRDTVRFHDAKVHGGRAFDLLHDVPVFRKVAVEPVVELVIEPKGKIGVGRAIADGLLALRIQLVKVLSIRNT